MLFEQPSCYNLSNNHTENNPTSEQNKKSQDNILKVPFAQDNNFKNFVGTPVVLIAHLALGIIKES